MSRGWRRWLVLIALGLLLPASARAFTSGAGVMVSGIPPTGTAAGVTSLGGATGALVLAAGSNLTLTPSGGDTFTYALGDNVSISGTMTIGTRTGTAAAFACFDSNGKLVAKASACL